MEILPYIQGFTDVDIESIKAAALRSKIEAIDKLQEALRRRDINCFISFLYALLDHGNEALAMEIARRGCIQLEYQPRSRAPLPQNIPSPLTEIGPIQALRGRSLASIGTPPTSSSSSVTPSISSKTESMEQQASGGTEEDLLTPEMELGDVPLEVTDRWAAELSKNKLWRELSKKIRFKTKEAMKIEKSGNAGNAFLGELVNRGYRVADLIKLLEGEKFSNFLQVIRIDLGESSYNNLNIGSSPVDNRFETVTLGLPRRNDSSSDLEENVQNNVIDSPLQNSSNMSESRSSSRSSSADTPKSENIVDSGKENMDLNITLTGHYISYGSEKKSRQKEDQQQQVIPTLSSGSREGTEGSDISPIIRETQKEIALANKRKGLDSSYSDSYPTEAPEQPFSLGIDSVHQTSPKSTFLDDNLNSSVNFSLEPKETSKKSVDKVSDLNVRTSTQDMPSRPREPVVQQEEDDAASQKGSSLMQGINDITKNLEEVGYEKQSYGARPSGSSINIPLQPLAAATEVGNPLAAPESTNASSQFDLFQPETGHQSAENLMGSQQMPAPYISPVPVSDDSDAKNLEMEASALREDMVNQSNTAGYRDIQYSIPDQNYGMENREYDSSLAGRYCYSTGERSQSQGQGHCSNVPTTARESLGRREGSTLGSRSSALNDCPSLNDSLLNEDTLTSNNTS